MDDQRRERTRITKQDSIFFREELGYLDTDGSVRKRDGFFRGDKLGEVRGNRAESGGIFSEEWGYVDANGAIYRRDGLTSERIGQVRGNNPQGALAHYMHSFTRIEQQVDELEHQVQSADRKGQFLGKVRGMLEFLPKAKAIGDFGSLKSRLQQLEQQITRQLEDHRRTLDDHRKHKEEIVHYAEQLAGSTDWKQGGAEFKRLQSDWKQVGYSGKEQEDALWQRFRSAADTFFERRKAFFEQQDYERSQNYYQKESLCKQAESLAYANDMRDATASVKSLQADWKAIGPVPREQADALWERFRAARDSVFAQAAQEREERQRAWEQRQAAWQANMADALARKEDQLARLYDSIAHDEDNVTRWQDTIYNLRPGPRADEIQYGLQGKIYDVQTRIAAKQERARELGSAISDMRYKLSRS